MMQSMRLFALIQAAVIALSMLFGAPVAAADRGPLLESNRVLITYESPNAAGGRRALEPRGGKRRVVVDLGRPVTSGDLESYWGPGVLAVEIDTLMRPLSLPDDPSLVDQWDMSDAEAGDADYSIRVPGAWSVTTGDSSLVVAVLDTGITSHSEFSGRLAPGYDFIGDIAVANDGNGRDGNPADPGDWVTRSENRSGYFRGCGVSTSSWHGTHVAGTIGATGNNGQGIAGVNWSSKILPVRVLGKCGGYTSDVADAIVWAAGGSVDGVPDNEYPARIINLSLGSSGSCSVAMQTAVDEARSLGATIVVAAGNSGGPVSNASPANCEGVISVAATGRDGKRAYYSNYGTEVTIAAPGGNYYGDSMIRSTIDSGAQGPVAESYATYQGTSMAAPHVAGVLSLLLSISPTLTDEEIVSLLAAHSTRFPNDTSLNSCSSASNCGPGIINASALIAAELPERLEQTIDFAELAPRYAGSAPFAPGATANSDLPISYTTSPASVCTVTASLVTLKAAGTCTITAAQPGNAEYLPAASVSQGITVLAATPPTVVTEPALDASPVVGTLLTLTPGEWGGDPTPDVAYRWYRCSGPGAAVNSTRDIRGCSWINGETGLTYTPAAADAGRYLRVRQVASNSAGSITRFSQAWGLVLSAPSLISGPSITSEPRVGKSVRANPGRFGGTSLSFSYAWYACSDPVTAGSEKKDECEPVDGAIGVSLVPRPEFRGQFLVLAVTVSNGVGSLTSFSASSARVR
jgi:subtilisin family serine protease